MVALGRLEGVSVNHLLESFFTQKDLKKKSNRRVSFVNSQAAPDPCDIRNAYSIDIGRDIQESHIKR